MTVFRAHHKVLALTLICATFVVGAPAQVLKTVAVFKGKNGGDPLYVAPVQGPDGGLYGTTSGGGTNSDTGTLFRMLNGKITAENSPPRPFAGLVLGLDGNFYGTSAGSPFGDGTIFKTSPRGDLTILHNFSGSDGLAPWGPLILASDGDFYGTTTYGGGNYECSLGCGTIFKITSAGLFSVLSNMGPGNAYPIGGLIEGADGNLYGTTSAGGNTRCGQPDGCGTIFRVGRDGRNFAILHVFQMTDGALPYSALTLGLDGAFYGTTSVGGTNVGGTVFRITANGNFQTIYNFCGLQDCLDGNAPYAALIVGTDGNFYGTTVGGGTNNNFGTVFSLTPTGVLKTLHSFCQLKNCSDGVYPLEGLVQHTNGLFYGMTRGISSQECPGTKCGSIFSLDMGLGPFVAFFRSYGRVGETGGLLGQGFTGTTSVSMNGIQAPFKVISDTCITATVPQGATTGFVTVTTPSGQLVSNVPFRVLSH